jgi:hypothetical protein
MSTSIFNNSELLNQVSNTFGVVIYQDTNYSDQSEKFYRFTIGADKNSPALGSIICVNGEFRVCSKRTSDGAYTTLPLLADIAQFMNVK